MFLLISQNQFYRKAPHLVMLGHNCKNSLSCNYTRLLDNSSIRSYQTPAMKTIIKQNALKTVLAITIILHQNFSLFKGTNNYKHSKTCLQNESMIYVHFLTIHHCYNDEFKVGAQISYHIVTTEQRIINVSKITLSQLQNKKQTKVHNERIICIPQVFTTSVAASL